jgi:hypothetical protein
MNARKKRYQDMNLEELEKATREYDRPGKPKFLKPPEGLAKAERRARKAAKIGRPVVGEGATAVLISIERGLLKEADRTAKARKMTRSELIALGLRSVIAGRKRSA